MPAREPSQAAGITVREIDDGAALRPFIDLAWRLNRGDPCWIAPLRLSVAGALDRRRHPFHRHAEVAYYLAERRGRPVGRIAAILNRRHNAFHSDRVGFFGLFECEDDPVTAGALFDAASAWLRARGCDRVRGPLNFSTNDEVASPGVLIDGFATRPSIMLSHNPPYYERLHESAGFVKAKDLLAFHFDDPARPPERGVRILDRLLEREGATVRPLDLRRFREDLDAIKRVYNSAWSRNWGFVPMTDEEFDHLAKEFRPVIDPDLCLIAEVGGAPIGFSLALPDLNEALAHLPNGRLFPFGILKLLWYRRRIRSIRVLTLGFEPRYHRAGLGVAFYRRTWAVGVEKGYVAGDASWVLEDNREMCQALVRMGGSPHRRYRIFERPLPGAAREGQADAGIAESSRRSA
jgi:GNAT superfamily N-acetyltransferase